MVYVLILKILFQLIVSYQKQKKLTFQQIKLKRNWNLGWMIYWIQTIHNN